MYIYEEQKKKVLTKEGQKMLLSIRKRKNKLLLEGVAKMSDLITGITGTGDPWIRMACVDRLVELGELKEVTKPRVWGQDRMFVHPRT